MANIDFSFIRNEYIREEFDRWVNEGDNGMPQRLSTANEFRYLHQYSPWARVPELTNSERVKLARAMVRYTRSPAGDLVRSDHPNVSDYEIALSGIGGLIIEMLG